MDPDPIAQFRMWLDEHVAAGLPEPTAMSLATASADGVPSNRMVLLKGVDDAGFGFFTNYESHKGRGPRRQPTRRARIPLAGAGPSGPHRRPGGEAVGRGVRRLLHDAAAREPLQRSGVAAEPGDRRPRGPRGRGRRAEAAVARGRHARPPHWGGYRVRPETIEFWTHRDDRLHDRLRYRRDGEVWAVERLAP